MWQTNLIKLYCAVCDNSSTIEAEMQRQSNNFCPEFTDEECVTVYLWGISQRRFEQKTIYEYTKNHLLEWFPKLPSCQAFSDRLNRLAPAFQALAGIWLHAIGVDWNGQREYIVDSCPIILAKGPRSGHGKVTRELCEKRYNSSRKEWYYGMKLHAIVARRPGCLPLPPSLMASGAAQHDLPAVMQILEDHIYTAENDDTLNVYADYGMRTGQVCDVLEVDLHLADGGEESLEYRLNAVEKAVLLRKMNDYCQQQTGRSLADCSAQLMTEDMEPPAGPVM